MLKTSIHNNIISYFCKGSFLKPLTVDLRGNGQNRTAYPSVFSGMLYQMSYDAISRLLIIYKLSA